MRAMRVLRLVVHGRTREPVAVLGETDGTRCVPVFLRRPQADAIALGLRGAQDLPLPQDVLLPLLRGLGHSLDGVEIAGLADGVFSAVVVCDGARRIPVLASDALAVAVREGLPIGMAEAVLDQVGQQVAEVFPDGVPRLPSEQPPEQQPAGEQPPRRPPPEEQLKEFRRFLDDVGPDDFADPPLPG